MADGEIKLHPQRQRRGSRKTERYEVVFQNGQRRIKLLDEDDAELFREAGAKLKKLERGKR
jgi:hypothetical protein